MMSTEAATPVRTDTPPGIVVEAAAPHPSAAEAARFASVQSSSRTEHTPYGGEPTPPVTDRTELEGSSGASLQSRVRDGFDSAVVEAMSTGSTRDKQILLQAELELDAFLDSSTSRQVLGPMLTSSSLNSYQRLLIHRLGDSFAVTRTMEDGRIYIEKTSETSRPPMRLVTLLPQTYPSPSDSLPESTDQTRDQARHQPQDLADTDCTLGDGDALLGVPPAVKPVKIMSRTPSGRSLCSVMETPSRSALAGPQGVSLRGSHLAVKDKLSFEERQAAYAQARERIFASGDRTLGGVLPQDSAGSTFTSSRGRTPSLPAGVEIVDPGFQPSSAPRLRASATAFDPNASAHGYEDVSSASCSPALSAGFSGLPDPRSIDPVFPPGYAAHTTASLNSDTAGFTRPARPEHTHFFGQGSTHGIPHASPVPFSTTFAPDGPRPGDIQAPSSLSLPDARVPHPPPSSAFLVNPFAATLQSTHCGLLPQPSEAGPASATGSWASLQQGSAYPPLLSRPHAGLQTPCTPGYSSSTSFHQSAPLFQGRQDPSGARPASHSPNNQLRWSGVGSALPSIYHRSQLAPATDLDSIGTVPGVPFPTSGVPHRPPSALSSSSGSSVVTASSSFSRGPPLPGDNHHHFRSIRQTSYPPTPSAMRLSAELRKMAPRGPSSASSDSASSPPPSTSSSTRDCSPGSNSPQHPDPTPPALKVNGSVRHPLPLKPEWSVTLAARSSA